MSKPLDLFISYAHKDKAMKNRLIPHFAGMVSSGVADIWHDEFIEPGDRWFDEIDREMQKADAALFLLSSDFLNSNFIQQVEVEKLLTRHHEEGVLIFFAILRPCDWKPFKYVSDIQLLPTEAKPVTRHRLADTAYTEIASAIRKKLQEHKERQNKVLIPVSIDPLQFSKNSLLKLIPGGSEKLFGREKELAQLKEAGEKGGVFVWVGSGGVGKSALTRRWLLDGEWGSDTRFFGTSFYSQGTKDQAATSGQFLADS
ncbi:MAG: toll/interleukin-1 receptor domain-containing protein, partial [Magnetococcales bacterium]|nr:toll/interleukin-1 receptor domain-containing protein [Magnetococcales bacterium]